MSLAILILAAGESARMGRPKQLLPFGDTSLLGYVADASLEAGCGPVFVVLGANADSIRASLRGRDLHFIQNDGWQSGIGSSIGLGIAGICAAFPELTAVMVLLADQPRIDAVRIRSFAERSHTAAGQIVAAAYAGTIGVPAVFPATLFSELCALSPEKGAKPLLERNSASLVVVPLDENPDIDTPEDYDTLIRGAVDALAEGSVAHGG